MTKNCPACNIPMLIEPDVPQWRCYRPIGDVMICGGTIAFTPQEFRLWCSYQQPERDGQLVSGPEIDIAEQRQDHLDREGRDPNRVERVR